MSNILQQMIALVKEDIAQLPQMYEDLVRKGENPEDHDPYTYFEEISELLGVLVFCPLTYLCGGTVEEGYTGLSVAARHNETGELIHQIFLYPIVFLNGERILNLTIAHELAHILSEEDHDHPDYLSTLEELLGEPVENPIPIPTEEEDKKARQEFERLVPQAV